VETVEKRATGAAGNKSACGQVMGKTNPFSTGKIKAYVYYNLFMPKQAREKTQDVVFVVLGVLTLYTVLNSRSSLKIGDFQTCQAFIGFQAPEIHYTPQNVLPQSWEISRST